LTKLANARSHLHRCVTDSVRTIDAAGALRVHSALDLDDDA
jgi:hypothetical protein